MFLQMLTYVYVPLCDADYQRNGQYPISSTNKKIEGKTLGANGKDFVEFSPPRALKTEEIPKIVNEFRIAARNARAAGRKL